MTTLHCEAKLRPQIEVFVVIERREERFESEAIRGAEHIVIYPNRRELCRDETGRFWSNGTDRQACRLRYVG